MASSPIADLAAPSAQLTPNVLLSVIMAASGGIMYGYDLVVAGGISVMDDFLAKFYPNVLVHKKDTHQDNYCKYNNDVFQLYSSCLYLAALPTTFLASSLTRRFGCKPTMLAAGLLFIAGTAIGTAAQNLSMLLCGRILLGGGLGFSNQAVNLYLAEIAPPRIRGRLHFVFGLYIASGILFGNVVNYFAAKIHPWGWRLSLGFAGVPSVLFAVFSLLLVESPSNLIQRGNYEEAKEVLAKIRSGPKGIINAEFEDLVAAAASSRNTDVVACCSSFKCLLKRRNIPQLVLGIGFPFFQQLAGNDAILFYGVFLFKTAGFGDLAALYSAVIVGAALLVSTIAAIFSVDRFGRRKLLFAGAALMISAMVVIASIFATGLPGSRQKLPRAEAIVEVVMVCVFCFGFAGSVGVLAWVIPSEIFSHEVRTEGLSVTVAVNMLVKFVIAQTFLSMLCAFKYGIFLFFGGWLVLMVVFVALLMPETKGVPIEAMGELWATHWLWRRVVPPLELPPVYNTGKSSLGHIP